ncbi:MAG: hypothetical protein ACI8RD_011690 [Bacillariaceae sp.]|jgi:hypothetical protein
MWFVWGLSSSPPSPKIFLREERASLTQQQQKIHVTTISDVFMDWMIGFADDVRFLKS